MHMEFISYVWLWEILIYDVWLCVNEFDPELGYLVCFGLDEYHMIFLLFIKISPKMSFFDVYVLMC